MKGTACNVIGCRYVAIAALPEHGGFPVCALHDGVQIRRMLDRLERPGAFWSRGRPIILPVGELTEADLRHREDAQLSDPSDDPMLADIDTSPCAILPEFDLTR